jgi:hypothetical protein
MVIWSIEETEMHIWPVVICGQTPRMIQIRSTMDKERTMWIERDDIDAQGKVTNFGVRARLVEDFPLYFRVPYVK